MPSGITNDDRNHRCVASIMTFQSRVIPFSSEKSGIQQVCANEQYDDIGRLQILIDFTFPNITRLDQPVVPLVDPD